LDALLGAHPGLLNETAGPGVRTALHHAVFGKSEAGVKFLLEHGADPIGEGDYHELGVLGWATAWEYVEASPEIVDYLLAHGARHNIFSAVATGDTQAIRDLISRSPADLERRMDLANRRRRPLHLAVVKKQSRALTALLELGAR
jgi:ankyrin repeat protein